jgi:succinate dehydrogenase hydrophobic anchor subunit
MAQHPDPTGPTESDREQAREYVVQRLAAVSAAIWALGFLGFMLFVFPNGTFKPTVGMGVGMWLFALAALPWAGYRPLVKRVARRHPWRG